MTQHDYAPEHVPAGAYTPTLTCRFCGAAPAIKATIRGHQGFLIMMRFLKLPGPYCKSCGISTVRDMSAKSLWQGWWGFLSLLINPLTLLWNLVVWIRLRRLPDDVQPGPGAPMDEGRPLYLRPAIAGLLIPVAIFGFIAYSGSKSASGSGVGDCVVNTGSESSPDVEKADCSSAKAQYRIAGKLLNTTDPAGCSQYPSTVVTYTYKATAQKYVLCLEPANGS